MRFFILFFLGFSLMGQDIFEHAKRGENYRVWVYFDERDLKSTIDLSLDAEIRRKKHNVETPTKFDYNIKQSYIEEIEKIGAKIKTKSHWLNAISAVVNKKQIEIIQSLIFVKKVEPVFRYKRKTLSNSIQSININRENDYGGSQTQIEQINCHLAHNAGFFGQGIKILYIDTGYELNHSAFDSINIVAEFDFINGDQNTSNETFQDSSNNQTDHGTTCLSVIAGYAPGHLIGPAYKAEYLLAKTELTNDEIYQEVDNYVAALEWGESLGADITCGSVGHYDWYSYEDLDGNTAAASVAVDIASSLGVLCVNSAGNEGHTSWNYIIPPSDADSIISVGSVNSDNIISYFSSRGPSFDGRIKPEVCAMGSNAYCVRSNTLNGYRNSSGTSFSAPLVAGAAAVVLSANPSWTNMQIREALMMTASKSDQPDNIYGYGIIDTWEAINYMSTVSLHNEPTIASQIEVHNAYPNPFNPEIEIVVNVFSKELNINSNIYDISGKFIEKLFVGSVSYGIKKIIWNASNYPSGIYIISTEWDKGRYSQKVTLLR